MRIPLPKSKLVTLALVAILGSGVATAALAAPAIWTDSPTAIGDHASPLRLSSLLGDDADDDHDDEHEDDAGEWEHEDPDEDDD